MVATFDELLTMANHCVYFQCPQCGQEYCVRCHVGYCPKCGTGFYDKQTLTFEQMTQPKLEKMLADLETLSNAEKNLLLHKLSETSNEEPAKPSLFKEVFCDFYKEKFNTNYYFAAKDYMAMKQLMLKIKNKHLEQLRGYDNDIALNAFKHYLNAVYNLKNDWYNSNFSMPILNSKFNELYIAISGKKQGNISNDYKQRVLNDLQS